MAERRENSVLFSLRELRNIEDERVKQEEAEDRARIEGERKAREDEIRLAKEAEEQKRRDEEDRIRGEQLERERIERDGQLRLQESEKRAQIEAATRLEQARIQAAAHAAAAAKRLPVKRIIGGIAALILVSGGVMGYLVNKHNTELKEQQAAAEAKRQSEIAVLRHQQEEENKAYEKEVAELKGSLEKASTEAEKAKIREKLAAATERSATVSKPRSSEKSSDSGPKPTKVNTSTNDPLGGLGF